MSGGYLGFDPKKFTLVSPIFTGAPTSPTPPQFNNTERLATTEFVQRALGNFAASRTVSANITLDVSYVGTYVNAQQNANPYTVTLPPIANCPTGSVITFLNSSSNKVTVQRNGADVIYSPAPVDSINLGAGDTVALTSILGVWQVSGGSAVLAGAASFGSSLAASGYQKLPSGLIIQWGSYTQSGTPLGANNYYVAANQNFPIAFPNQCVKMVCSSLLNFCVAQAVIVSASQFTPRFSQSGGTVPINVDMQWIAIGY